MNRLVNAIKLHASSLDGQGAETRVGKITSVGPDGTTAKVKLHPSDPNDPKDGLTGWLPVGCIGVGAASIVVPPNVGDLVMVEPLEGDAENWMITKRLFTTSAPPQNSPATNAPVKPGEVGIFVNNGTVQGAGYLHFTNDGSVHLGGVDIMLTGTTIALAGTIDMTGSVVISGPVAITGSLTVSDKIIVNGTTVAVP